MLVKGATGATISLVIGHLGAMSENSNQSFTDT